MRRSHPSSDVLVCEHQWTIVYIGDAPIGIGCKLCRESRPCASQATDVRHLALAVDAHYQFDTDHGLQEFVLINYELRRELRQPNRLMLEFVGYMPF